MVIRFFSDIIKIEMVTYGGNTMAKKKQQKPSGKKQKDEKLSLGDLLNDDIVSKLKHTQQQLQEEAQKKQDEELERQREERRKREKISHLKSY